MLKEQYQQVATTGRTNMFDVKAVFEIAVEMGFFELTDFIFMSRMPSGKKRACSTRPKGT